MKASVDNRPPPSWALEVCLCFFLDAGSVRSSEMKLRLNGFDDLLPHRRLGRCAARPTVETSALGIYGERYRNQFKID